jgi:hypothetical protein
VLMIDLRERHRARLKPVRSRHAELIDRVPTLAGDDAVLKC